MNADPFKRVSKFGCPWHGKLESTTLTLPDSTTKTWVAATGHGGIDVVQPAGVGSTSNDAADTAAGREWRNYALISGESRVFYGKVLGFNRWVYVPAQGNAFHCRIISGTGTGNSSDGSASLTIGVRRMAIDGTSDAERSISISLSPIGQKQISGADVSLRLDVHTQSSSGAKVLLSVQRSTGNNKAALGWLILSLEGTTKAGITATLAVWKTRIQTHIYSQGGSSTYTGPVYFYSPNKTAWPCTHDIHSSMEYVASGYFDGEVAKPISFLRAMTDVGSNDDAHLYTETDQVQTVTCTAKIDGATMATVGFVFHGHSYKDYPVTYQDFTVEGTWTNEAGSSVDMALSIGNWELTNCINAAAWAPIDAEIGALSSYQVAHDWYHSATPGVTLAQIWNGSIWVNGNDYAPVQWRYANASGAATFRLISPKVAVPISQLGSIAVPGPVKNGQLISPYTPDTVTSNTLTNWLAQRDLRGAVQPLTGQSALRTDAVVVTYV